MTDASYTENLLATCSTHKMQLSGICINTHLLTALYTITLTVLPAHQVIVLVPHDVHSQHKSAKAVKINKPIVFVVGFNLLGF